MSDSSQHPLERPWTFYYSSRKGRVSTTSWQKNIHEIKTVQTVEDFWSLYNNLVEASQLHSGSDYYIFREGSFPSWEHESNRPGGTWTVTIPAKQAGQVDEQWMHSVLKCVGETFSHSHLVNGIVLSVRRGKWRIALWTADASQDEQVLSMGNEWADLLRAGKVKQQLTFDFHVHEELIKSDGSADSRHTL